MHLLCTLNGAPVGFAADAVREVVPLPMIVPLPLPTRPGAPVALGAVNLRGQLTPVFDLCIALEVPFCPPSPRDNLVVLERGGRLLCVRVSLVHDVQTLLSHQAVGTGILENIARSGDQIVRVVRIETLFEALDAPRTLGSAEGANSVALDSWRDLRDDERTTLEARAASLAKPLQSVASGLAAKEDNAHLWAVVRWGGELFGLDLEFVREFAPLRALAPIPLSAPHLLGLMNLRGDILPILDLREITGAASGNSPPPLEGALSLGEKVVALDLSSGGSGANSETVVMQIVVVEHAGSRFGLWVDEVVDVFAAASSQIQDTPLSSREESELLQGSIAFGGRRLGLLDLDKALEKLSALEARV